MCKKCRNPIYNRWTSIAHDGQNYTYNNAVVQLVGCATNRKVAGSIPDGVIRIFH